MQAINPATLREISNGKRGAPQTKRAQRARLL